MTEPDLEDSATSPVQRYLWAGIVGFCVIVAWYSRTLDPDLVAERSHYGLLSIVPAVAALAICFLTRNVILALFMGVVIGGLVTTDYNIIQAFLIPAIGTPRFAEILLVYLWALGGLLGIWNRNGGAWHFATYVSENFVQSRRSAMFFTWLMGVIFHQGGTISTVLTGTTVRPVADREKVAHEELAYIVDSTASPVATIIPINVWPFYVAGLIAIPSMSHIAPDAEAARTLFYQAIPYNFYGWFAILFTLLFALGKLPFMGKAMRAARERVLTTGALDAPGAAPMLSRELTTVNVPEGYRPSLLDFFVPILTLMSVAVIPYFFIGRTPIFEAFGLALISAIVLSVVRGMPLKVAFDGLVDGIKGVTVGAIILALAVTLAKVSDSVGASAWTIDTSADALASMPYILPGLLMLICMLTSFSIGSSWGTYAVVFPIALPLAYTISSDPTFVTMSFAAILGGAVFGDQCSPISDTTILASLACGSDLMDHVLTQLPMAMAAAGIAVVLYTGIALVVL